MKTVTGPRGWLAQLRRQWLLHRLTDPAYAFVLEPPPPDEWVALDCETTGLNVRRRWMRTLSAGTLLSGRTNSSSRPLVGYYLEFDVAMLNRALWPLLGMGLPQPAIEVSAMYYEHKFRQLPPYQQHANADIDLRFATLMDDLGLPRREAHDALNDAVMAALAFVKLRQLHGAG